MVKLAVSVAVILVAVIIVYGTLQAEEELNKEVAVPTAEVVEVLAPKPAREYELTGSDLLLQVRGGDDACRFMYTHNRVSTFAETEMKLWFVAGVWETDLGATGEMDLYGPNGPHRFEIVGPSGQTVMSLDVGRGATEYATVTFPEVGLYYLYNSLTQIGAVGEIFARPVGQPGGGHQSGWCQEEKPLDFEEALQLCPHYLDATSTLLRMYEEERPAILGGEFIRWSCMHD